MQSCTQGETRGDASKHPHTEKHQHRRIPTHICQGTHRHANTDMHPNTGTHAHPNTHVHEHSCTHVGTRSCVQAPAVLVHTHTHAVHAHTCMVYADTLYTDAQTPPALPWGRSPSSLPIPPRAASEHRTRAARPLPACLPRAYRSCCGAVPGPHRDQSAHGSSQPRAAPGDAPPPAAPPYPPTSRPGRAPGAPPGIPPGPRPRCRGAGDGHGATRPGPRSSGWVPMPGEEGGCPRCRRPRPARPGPASRHSLALPGLGLCSSFCTAAMSSAFTACTSSWSLPMAPRRRSCRLRAHGPSILRGAARGGSARLRTARRGAGPPSQSAPEAGAAGARGGAGRGGAGGTGSRTGATPGAMREERGEPREGPQGGAGPPRARGEGSGCTGGGKGGGGGGGKGGGGGGGRRGGATPVPAGGARGSPPRSWGRCRVRGRWQQSVPPERGEPAALPGDSPPPA